MSTNIEIEAKVLLSKEDYLNLLNLNLGKPYVQINYYIDNSSHSFTKKYGLRIRYKNNKYEMTFKEDYSEGKLETNQIIDKDDFLLFKNNGIFIDGEIKNKLISLNIDINTLLIIGEMKTTRIDFPYNSSLLSLDKSEYNGLIDYELEAEDASLKMAKKNIVTFLENHDINFKFNRMSKLQRFVKSLDKR